MTVYLTAESRDSTTRALLANANVLTQAVAERMRALLGASSGQLPSGEPTITWRGIGSGLAITAYRDGHMVSRVASDRDDRPSSALIARAFDALLASGDAWFLWPDSAVDSLSFDLELRPAMLDRAGNAHLLPMQFGVPVFTVGEPLPLEEDARMIQQPPIHYPRSVESERIEGYLVLQFIVDWTGRVDTSTVRDVWPANRPRLTGEMGRYYQALVNAVRAALPDARFEPARIDGCPVSQLVQMPFAFKMDQ
ncbi:MAG TPA: hypothetical protein VFJ96_03225 [Gemmatimonadaceae bacterium]|nr:hypothetical protein [Gemmatimonadaceae bacterium]